MSEMNRPSSVPDELKSLLTPPVSQGLTVLNGDGHDCRLWWQLDTVEQTERMDNHDRAWWTRHRLVAAAEALRAGIIEATKGLK